MSGPSNKVDNNRNEINKCVKYGRYKRMLGE